MNETKSVKSTSPYQSVFQTKYEGHGGELKVETKEGEGTTFIITITA